MLTNFLNSKNNHSKIILGLYISTIVLLPFSRYAELPILILAIIGIRSLIVHKQSLKSKPQFKILSIIFACYFFMVLLSSFDSYWQQKTLIVAIASLRFYFATIALLMFINIQHFKLLIKSITLLAIFWSFDALLQSFTGTNIFGSASYAGRLTGIFGEHQVKLGPVLAFLLPMVLIGLKTHKSYVRWISVFVLVLVIILSGTRSAWIMAFVILLAYWFHHVKTRRIQLLLKSSIVAIAMLVSLWFISPEFQQRMERSLTVFDGTQAGLDFALADRLSIWNTSWSMIQQHPINGIGAHGFRKAYPKFASSNDVWQQNDGVGMHAHHWILEVLAETGIIGLVLMTFAIYKLLLFVKKYYNHDYSWAYLIALSSMFLPIISTYSIFASFWSICIWFIGAGLIVVSTKEAQQND